MRPMTRRFMFRVGAPAAFAALAVLAAAPPASAAPAPSAASPPSATTAGSLYVIQGVDATTMELALDGRTIAAAAAAKTVVGPLSVTAGRHVLTGTPAGGGAPIEATVTVPAGGSLDAVVHRQVDPSAAPVFTAFTNDLSAVTPGSGRLTVAHMAAVGPADIRVKGKVLFANVANGEQLSLTVPAGTYPVEIVPASASSPVVFGPANLPVTAASLTRVFAIGVAATGSMDAVVQVLPIGARGAGAEPSRVEAGDGGQAQALINRHERGGAAPSPAIWAALAALLAVGAALRLLPARAHRKAS